MNDALRPISPMGMVLRSIRELIQEHVRSGREGSPKHASTVFLVLTVLALVTGFAKLFLAGVFSSGLEIHPDRSQLLKYAIASAQEAKLDGIWLEFGVASGESIRYIAEVSQQPVFGFDSFEGLPAGWNFFFRKGAFSTGGVPPNVPHSVSLVTGLFDQSLPKFLSELPLGKAVSFVHIDADLYTSTHVILSNLSSRIRDGTVIVFDEYCQILPDDEARAMREAAEKYGWRFRYLGCAVRGTGSLPVALRIGEASN